MSQGWDEGIRRLSTHQGLGLLDVLMAEEELAIEVAQVDCVEIDNVDFAKPSKGEVLEEFAADAAGAYKQHTRLGSKSNVRPISK